MNVLRKIFLVLAPCLLSSCGAGLCIESYFCSTTGIPAADLQLQFAADMEFGIRPPGSVTPSYITVTNQGTETATNISAEALDAPFTYTGGSYPGVGGTCADQLAAGATCLLGVTYSAAGVTGTASSELELSYFDSISDREASIDLSAESSVIVFGRDLGPDASGARTVRTNEGLYIAGQFSTWGHLSAPKLVRLNSDYEVDTTFSIGTGFSPTIVDLVIESTDDNSGDLWVGGNFTTLNGSPVNRLVRLNPSGSLDTLNAGTGPGSSVRVLKRMGDGSGRIYVGGSFTTYDGTGRNYFLRINSDGSVDNTFTVGTGFTNTVWAIAETSDGTGDIYVGGQFTQYNGNDADRIVRLSNTGAYVASFDSDPGFDSTVNEIAVAVDGTHRVYVSGSFVDYNGNNTRRLARLNTNGTFDATFATGVGFTNLSGAILPATDGSGDVYFGTMSSNYNGTANMGNLVRLDSNGSLDTSFGGGTRFNGEVKDLTFSSTGEVIAVGDFTFHNGTPLKYAAWLETTGEVHPSSPIGGGFTGNTEYAASFNDGSADVLVGGNFGAYDSTGWTNIARLNADGTVDTGFNPGVGFNGPVSVVAMSPNSSRFYAGGTFSHYNGVSSAAFAAVLGNGTIDSSFVPGAGFNGAVNDIEVAPDGMIYVVGAFTQYKASTVNRIARLFPDGTLDASFTGTGFDSSVFDITRLSNGQLYAVGNFTQYNGNAYVRIVRINSDGTADATFDPLGGFNTPPYYVLPANDGSGDIYVGGSFTLYRGVGRVYAVRLNSDASVDTGFATGTSFNGVVVSMVMQADGNICWAGDFTSYNGSTATRLARTLPTGALDTSFAIGAGANAQVNAITLATDGTNDLIAVGDFTTFKTSTTHHLVRLSTTGTVK